MVGEESPDVWTKLAAVTEMCHGFLDNLLLLAPTIDNLAAWSADTPIGISRYGLAIASTFSLLITLGTTYCSYLLNMRHQQATATPALGPVTTIDQPLLSQASSLSLTQKAALATHYIGTAAEVTGPANYLLNLITANRINRWAGAGVNAALMAVGFIGTWADTRTVKNAMVRQNQKVAASARLEV